MALACTVEGARLRAPEYYSAGGVAVVGTRILVGRVLNSFCCSIGFTTPGGGAARSRGAGCWTPGARTGGGTGLVAMAGAGIGVTGGVWTISGGDTVPPLESGP